MTTARTIVLAAALSLALPGPPVAAQSERIHGTVITTAGTSLEGVLRWDRNEVAWDDVLDGSKPIPEDQRELLSAARAAGAVVRDRSIEYAGYRITWDDSREELASLSEAGIRFGHIRRIAPDGRGAARVTLRSGGEVRLEGGGTDLGSGFRGLIVEASGGPVEIDWDEIAEVRLSPAPVTAVQAARRLWGTAVDRSGATWTGWVTWGADQVLADDELVGEVDGDRRRLSFREVRRIERRGFRVAEVTAHDGTVYELRGADATVAIGDPALGRITIPWNELSEVAFSEAPSGIGSLEGWPVDAELRGVVTLSDGSVRSGPIRWDADEAATWEILDGSVGDVDVDVEFSFVARVEPEGGEASRVVLRDGRELVMDGSNDVNSGNRGIYVQGTDGEWSYIDWYDVASVDFDPVGPESGR